MSLRLIIFFALCISSARAAETLTRWDGWPGPIEGELKIPAGVSGEFPLVTVGPDDACDMIVVRVLATGHVRFGFSHGGQRIAETAGMDLAATQPHRLIIALGSLLPPLHSEIYWQQPHLLHLTKQLLVMLDGRTLLAQPAEFVPSPATLRFSFDEKIFTRVKGASEAEVARGVLPLMGRSVTRDAGWHGFAGPVRFQVQANAQASHEHQPLLSTGRLGAGDLIYWSVQPDGRARIGFLHTGARAIESEPLPLREGPQEILISADGLLPPPDDDLAAHEPELAKIRGQLFVELNGRVALSAQAPFHPSRAATIVFGADIVESRPAVRYFEGAGIAIVPLAPTDVLEASARVVDRTGAPSRVWSGWPGPIRIKMKFPTDRAGIAEPLLCTGRTGAADLIYVRYVDARHVRIAFDHWGVGGPVSEPIEIDPAATQEMMVSFGALFPPEGSALFNEQPALREKRAEVRVTLNGRVAVAVAGRSHPSAPEKILFGRNPVGASSCVPEFSGKLVEIQPAPEVLAPGK